MLTRDFENRRSNSTKTVAPLKTATAPEVRPKAFLMNYTFHENESDNVKSRKTQHEQGEHEEENTTR